MHSQAGWTFCRPCGTGRFSEFEGSATCESCPVGKDSNAGALKCFDCPPGHSRSEGESECRPCKAGTTSPGGEECKACALGRYAADEGLSECKLADAGSNVPARGATKQEKCTAGRSSGTAAEYCSLCGDGTISDAGKNDCTLVDPGRAMNAQLDYGRRCGQERWHRLPVASLAREQRPRREGG